MTATATITIAFSCRDLHDARDTLDCMAATALGVAGGNAVFMGDSIAVYSSQELPPKPEVADGA